jgi:hypothetical protein
MMTKTPLLVAMALSAAQNNNQHTKGANKRGDNVKAMVTVRAMVTATIRSAKQDDNYGASNIVLPCPGS